MLKCSGLVTKLTSVLDCCYCQSVITLPELHLYSKYTEWSYCFAVVWMGARICVTCTQITAQFMLVDHIVLICNTFKANSSPWVSGGFGCFGSLLFIIVTLFSGPSLNLVLLQVSSCWKGRFPSYCCQERAHSGSSDCWDFLKYYRVLR